MAEEPLLVVDKIDACYGTFKALWEVSLEVRRGEIVSLVGANGAGKTTTLKCVMGLVTPLGGRVCYKGQEVKGLETHDIVSLGISLVPEGRIVFPELTVEENLKLGSYTERARPKRGKMLERVYELFPVLPERRRQVAGTLSGGEQQMLAIGRALMSDPELVLMDEISLGLAPIVIDRLYNAIERINSDGVSILLVEQNVSRSLKEADRAYVLKSGRITLSGSSENLRQEEEIKRAYFGLQA